MFCMIVSFGLGLGLGFAICNKEYLKNTCQNTCQNIYKLYRVLEETTKYKNVKKLSASWGVLQVGLKMSWIYLEQKLRQTCVKHQNVYHIQFVIGSSLYKIIIKPPRGPRAFDWECIDSNGKTKTNELIPFIRGLQSQVKITPKLLGETQLTFVDSFGQNHTFTDNEPVRLN